MSESSLERRPPPPPLPSTAIELSGFRHLKIKRSINDVVEDVIYQLWEDDEFQSFIFATYDEDAVTGSLAFDNFKAAEMITKKAEKLGLKELTTVKVATVAKAMNVVLRRHRQDRKLRRNTVKGVVVPSADNNAE